MTESQFETIRMRGVDAILEKAKDTAYEKDAENLVELASFVAKEMLIEYHKMITEE